MTCYAICNTLLMFLVICLVDDSIERWNYYRIRKQFIFFLSIKDICFDISGDQESTEVNARNERSHLVVWQVPLNQDNIDD